MTLGNLLSQMGIGTKQLTERFSHGDYGGAPAHDSHLIYSYEPSHSSHGHVASSKHHYGGGGHKSNAAMSALTLLSFLFFLHILQQCLREHMQAMSTPPVMIMTAGREGEEIISKSTSKIDKTGETRPEAKHNDVNKITLIDDEKETLMKIDTAEYTPKNGAGKIKHVTRNNGNVSLGFPGFVSAMDYD